MQSGTNSGGLMAKQGEDKRTDGLRLPEEVQRCPRCDSSNTKFCYYNNYSLSQPRHFCKTCRRYWTKGGALRNVPIGGGCRKNKKSTTNKANSSFASSKSFNDEETKIGVINNSNISSIVQLPSETLAASNALKLFNGFSSSPSIDFHVGCLPKFQPSALNRFLSSGDLSSSSSSSVTSNGMNSGLGLCGYSPGFWGSQGSFMHSSVASSIESLSIMNADLHWKLQQQRFAMLLAEGSDHSGMYMSGYGIIDQSQYGPNHQHQQQICLQNPNSVTTTDGACSFGSSKKTASVVECGEPRGSEWIFENSWPDLHQYSSLP